ncbi:unnamed protein product [Miscanthus lutarioriparius]|uniref:Purple acid phosphatase n=1 Tax=Miscanthus lutarioriparius TaxID=422564 RepID=A0A811QK60_9POAL|nr:unnamed protein product [Miscanthus lutarioriparius]
MVVARSFTNLRRSFYTSNNNFEALLLHCSGPESQMMPSVHVHDDEYVRSPQRPLVLTAHDKPASHPQQVHISAVGAHGMRITWVTDDRSAPSVVEYGTSPGEYTAASETGYQTSYQFLSYTSGAIHHVTIGPLEPGTTYYTTDGVDGVDAVPNRRRGRGPRPRHGAASGRPLVRGRPAAAVGLVGAAGAAAGERAAVDGDGREPREGDAARARQAGAALRGVRRAVAHAARGELDASGGKVHVVMLGSYAELEAEGSEQQQHAWLRRDLAAVDRRRTPWLLVLMHVPWYNTNWAHQGEAESMRRAMESLLYEARVDVVFASHTHAYERFERIYDNKANSQGPMYITIGDAGNNKAHKFMSDHKLAHLSLFREVSFGHGRLRIMDNRRTGLVGELG